MQVGGNVTMIFALILPTLLLVSIGALDFARYRKANGTLQAITEFASVAGAKEMTLANATKANIEASVNNILQQRLAKKYKTGTYTYNTQADMTNFKVTATVTHTLEGFTGENFFPGSGQVNSSSTAVATSSSKLCMISLNATDNLSINIQDSASINAAGCTSYSNSIDKTGVVFEANTSLTADMLCSSGGISNASKSFSATEVTDCPQLTDPLASRAAPSVPAYCDETNLRFSTKYSSGGSVTLSPGVYCGGIDIDSFAKVTLSPGIYIIKDGILSVDKYAELRGSDVSFYFTGNNSFLRFRKNSIIELSAPVSGTMAGILMMEDKNNPVGKAFKISSDDANKLLGTVYLPNGTLIVDADQPVGKNSAYTIIVANKIELSGAPNLYLNTDYASTSVPVPEGVGPVGGNVYLLD